MPDSSAAFRDKTILVTGGAGAIGTNLVAALSAYEAERIVVFDNLSSGYGWNVPHEQYVDFVKGDVVNDRDLENVFKERPQIVYHLAAHFEDVFEVSVIDHVALHKVNI